MRHEWRFGFFAAIAGTFLAACSPDEQAAAPGTGAADIPEPVQQPASQLPGPSAPPAEQNPPATVNTVPVITGPEAPSATAGTPWSYQVSATDSDGDELSYTASGLPEWASIDPESGTVQGTPSASDTGTSATIVVSVSDGQANAALPAITVPVEAAPIDVSLPGGGSATLSWQAPTEYTDGLPLLPSDQVVGYRVYHGTSAGTLDSIIPVNDPAMLYHTVEQLSAGTHYFAVSAVSVTGVEGERSEILSKTVM